VVIFVHDEEQVLDLTDAATSPDVELARPRDLVVLDLTDGGGPVLDLTGSDAEAVIDLTDASMARAASSTR
jgi:hypothetical protein